MPGEEFILHLSVIVKTGWHIYSLSPLSGNELLATQIFIDENVFQENMEKMRHFFDHLSAQKQKRLYQN